MKIIDIRALKGPNYWSIKRPKLIVMRLDLEQLEEFPSNRIDGFYERLQHLIPSLYTHECSEGRPGGFFYRVERGTWMGHIIEHIALEIQTLAGMDCGFGRTRSTGDYGIYNVVFAYQEERAGLQAAYCAVNIAQALIEGRAYDLQADITLLSQLYEEDRLGPSTAAIVNACVQKGVPYTRLDTDSTVLLGYGIAQKRIQAAVSSQTSSIAVELAADKHETKRRLGKAAIPVPTGLVVETEAELQAALDKLGFPLVVKPLDGNHGRGVTTNIQTREALLIAFQVAKAHSEGVLIEQFAQGYDFRLLVIDYKLCAVAQRIPARVIGDGSSTISQLIDGINSDPRRGDGHVNLLTKISIDEATMAILTEQNLVPESVLPAGKELYLKKTANLSTGGTSIDMTDQVHPEIKAMAERTARVIGLDICGIDLIAQDITRSLHRSGAVVIEVNAGPGLRMHTHPSEGKPRDVGKAIADMLFPHTVNSGASRQGQSRQGQSRLGRIPIIAVTGTNGKTTTTRLTRHLIRQAGYTVGFTTTEGVYIGDTLIEEGDCTGPVSAEKVLQDPSVEFAVLECARGGMLRSGLAFDQCDVGIVTNVAADHLGLRDINSVEDMARVKAIVAESVKPDGYAVLNADNPHTYAMRHLVSSQVALFSMDPASERIVAHYRAGGLAAVYEDGYITLRRGDQCIQVEHVNNIPLAFEGKAPFMIENIMAAVLAAYCQELPFHLIAEGLRSFVPSFENTPGRMNLFCFRNYCVLVDYAHNPHGIAALGEYIKQAGAVHKVGILTGVGDRRDEDIIAVGRVAATLFDEIIIRFDEDSRGRDTDQIASLIRQGIYEIDQNKPTHIIPDELAALTYAIEHVQESTMIVHLSDRINRSVEIVREFKELEEKFDLHPDLLV
ncbi:cyanophycin synthetase [Spirosoma linguale]|uniref:Cyanophycin synthetase n=1 Tax=Spirosoma linguale (strain ATCC 33905 / DSM 74 / LMG 10896 / Claus 1) TaxID=504472 RepID=D2QJU3_SPILD|nr:cyanophycin synthetase [Spirosoma linguale DSM 74]